MQNLLSSNLISVLPSLFTRCCSLTLPPSLPPFLPAKPVDTASHEIEENLRREREEFEKRLAEQSKEDRDDHGSSQERHREGSRDRARDR